MPDRPISSDNQISTFFHCKRCLEEIPEGISPREWAQHEVGFTPIGLQVWCRRHEINIVHIDCEGQQHPANIGRKK